MANIKPSASTSAVTRVAGGAIVLRGHDIDTDRIIPARFLKTVTFDGLAANVFADDRAQVKRAGGLHPFDRDSAAGASVLIVNKNFGCGSSREHAPQALYRRGIRVVIGESFAEIFASNSLMIGLPCVSMNGADIEALMGIVEATKAGQSTEVAVDLVAQRAMAADRSWPIAMPDHVRHALTSGQWDGAGLLLEHYGEVEAVDASLPYSF